MKAKCPECFNEDKNRPNCTKCNGEGYVKASFRKGLLFTQYCLECKLENGGNIINKENPLLQHRAPYDGIEKCIMCGGETCWKYLGEI